MRCVACGAEMILVNVVPDDTMLVPGFEHRTFMCPACDDVERRLVFAKPGQEAPTEPVPVHAAPPIAGEPIVEEPVPPADTSPSIAPASPVPDERGAASGLFRRVVARMRGR